MIKIKMVDIPGGEFLMGSTKDDPNSCSDERPQRLVTVKPFQMGKYPITQAEWEMVMDNNPSHFRGENRPVERVSWEDAMDFCVLLSKQTGIEYCLPSEAEWEFACRAGTSGDYSGELDEMGWYDKNAGGETHPVGQKQANAFGLCDMHGNVWEWCRDAWHDSYEGAPTDSREWSSEEDSNLQVLRGGSWNDNSFNCRSALRDRHRAGARIRNGGLRVVRGGSWNDYSNFCRSAYRHWSRAGARFNDLGLRVIRGGSWINDSYNCRSANRNVFCAGDLFSYLGFRVMEDNS